MRDFINGEKLYYCVTRSVPDNIKDWFQSTSFHYGWRNPETNGLSDIYYSVPVDPDHWGSFQNTWNMPNKTTHGTGDFKVYKTVYDPCPPGFSVPHAQAFSFILKSGPIYTMDYNSYNDLNIVDTDGNGPSYSDFWHYDEAAHKMVANFYTSIGGGEMYPFTSSNHGGGAPWASIDQNSLYAPGSWLAATTTGAANGHNMNYFTINGFRQLGAILITPMRRTSGQYLLNIIPMKEHF